MSYTHTDTHDLVSDRAEIERLSSLVAWGNDVNPSTTVNACAMTSRSSIPLINGAVSKSTRGDAESTGPFSYSPSISW